MPSPPRSTATTLALCSVLLACSCSSGLVKSLRDTARLRQQLIDKYHEQDVNVSLQNSRFLFIVFVNSPLNQKDNAERARRAQDTAAFAVANYPAINRIENIWVNYIESESHFIVYHSRKSLGFFVFDRNGVAVSSSGTKEEDLRTPVVRFNAARNQTDISITRLQLEGDMNHGIALVPHFTITGNAQDTKSKLVAPDWVGFDFASYADRKIFAGTPKLEIRCDDVLAFTGEARLLAAQDSGSDGSTAQFLTAQIPFQQFSKIANAQDVRIKLGSKQFQLSAEDVNSLRAMRAYVPQPHGEGR
jgi:hypothetical protein